MKLNNRFYVNNVYRTKAGELVVFLGYQDGTLGNTHGFFRELKNPNTFFGLRLSQISFIYETN
jgi:hypothetical protein